jgi:hypothetical protein
MWLNSAATTPSLTYVSVLGDSCRHRERLIVRLRERHMPVVKGESNVTTTT